MASGAAQTVPAKTDAEHEFRGEIADSSCAMNVHSLTRSHKEMLKAGYMGTTASDCAHYCVRNFGSSFVLVSAKDVYKLDRQETAEKFAGRQVVVKGKLDSKNNIVAVSSMQLAGPATR
jgi:hypothetical protein